MAVTKVKYKQKSLYGLFDLANWVDEIKECEIKIVCMKKSVIFIRKGKSVGSVPIGLSAVDLMRDGELSLKRVNAYRLAIKIALLEVIDPILGPGMVDLDLELLDEKTGPYTVMFDKLGLKGVQKKKKKKFAALKAASEKIDYSESLDEPYEPVTSVKQDVSQGYSLSDYSVFPKDQMETAQRVKLDAATKLYQPVEATSGGSRYFVVAAGKDLKVACRYRNMNGDPVLSVRVEGDLKKYEISLQLVGFAYASGMPYTSMHLQVPDLTLAGKTVGAVVSGLNVEFLTQSPNVSVIYGKGQ